MILEAFSQTLHSHWHPTECSAVVLLHRWLLGILTEPDPQDMVSRIIQTEVALLNMPAHPTFVARSTTGKTLLNSLYQYCDSYEQWQFRRWLHESKPHHFNTQPS